MSYVFDASSIFKSIIDNKINILIGNYTDNLAKYELGNTIWKKYYIKKEISVKEYSIISRIVFGTLKLLKILDPTGSEQDILDIARKIGITFYDATYVYHSKRLGSPLVTEDYKLRNKIKNIIKVLSLNEIS